MALLNINDLISQYAMQSGVLNPQGQVAPPMTPKPQTGGLLDSPGLAQALLAMGSTMGQAAQQGYGFGPGLAIGAQAFGNTVQAEKDKIRAAEEKATQERLAALKDIISLKTQQEELGLRMQAASLARRAQQDALDAKAQEKADAEARKQAIMTSGDPTLINAYNMFGDQAAKELFVSGQKPKERKVVEQGGVAYYADTGEPVLPNAPSATKQTDTYRKENDLAKEALNALKDYKDSVYSPDGSLNRMAIITGMLSTSGRDILQPLETAIGNTVYLKTGAAATPGEIESLMKQYAPSLLDTKEQVDRKTASLEQFLKSKAPDYVPTGNRAKKPDATAAIPQTPLAPSGFTFIGVEGQ